VKQLLDCLMPLCSSNDTYYKLYLSIFK